MPRTLIPSRTSRLVAAVETAERARGHQADKQNAHTHGGDVIRGVRIEMSYARDEKIGGGEVRKPPQHVHGRG